jgi:hypothetical protein
VPAVFLGRPNCSTILCPDRDTPGESQPSIPLGKTKAFLDTLPIVVVDCPAAYSALDAADAWVLIDLAQKRIFTGRAVQLVGRDQVFAMVVDDNGQQHFPLSVHLPPWWELHEQVDAGGIRQPRQSPIQRPEVNREVLFGEPLLVDLAARVLAIVQSERWAQRDGDGQRSWNPMCSPRSGRVTCPMNRFRATRVGV